MEIVIVVLLLLVIAALVFAWMKFRPGVTGGEDGVADRTDGLRGRRGAAVAARHDPMAQAVEHHAMATDPHEAAEAEIRLQAQANRVAADLHARQASALESGVPGRGGSEYAAPVNGYGQPGAADGYADTAPANAYGQPVSPYDGPPPADGYADTAPANAYGQPVSPYDGPPPADGYADIAPTNAYGQPVSPYDGPPPADDRPVYEDEDGRPVYEDGTPVYREDPPQRY